MRGESCLMLAEGSFVLTKQKLMFAQDTGGAIRGAVRADFFWGFGAEAGALAGRMRQSGRMWLLWPKDSAPPRPRP